MGIFMHQRRSLRKELVRTTAGLEAHDQGCLVVHENDMTTHPGVFAAGDAVSGAKTVVHAVKAERMPHRP